MPHTLARRPNPFLVHVELLVVCQIAITADLHMRCLHPLSSLSWSHYVEYGTHMC